MMKPVLLAGKSFEARQKSRQQSTEVAGNTVDIVESFTYLCNLSGTA